ncbi:PREDICTED: scavenger receptor cysteine-rich type 1 protein M130-like [Branchiostoma belcheri]|uniref:Soluble scavenger receptor cysteine-rich domain-containing protein SSC5D n=1 Tax=Branchiostoma belcheri TaxID=7741 RepID=A0A6P5A6D5_BRABE|nr:PREDICTED: scavenger receptor cysteine-rich type 1 protein M130-like [Branchiostoma belcheri]
MAHAMATIKITILILFTFLSGKGALGGYSYMGCYADSDARVLPYVENWDLFQTTSKCVDHCRNSGYEYAGTEFSWQCFCGTAGNFASLAPAVSDGECNMACPGKPSENCGSTWRISIYAALALSNEVRLVGGLESSEGRLEVRVINTVNWGTVCSQGFDMNDLWVACRMLELGPPINFTGDTTYFGQGTGEIEMANLECSGHEHSLFSCPYESAGNHNCTHSSDVGVQCVEEEDDEGGIGLVIGIFSGFGVAFSAGGACVCWYQNYRARRARQHQADQARRQMEMMQYAHGQYTQQPPAQGQYGPEPTQYGQYTQPPTQPPPQYGLYSQPPTQYGLYSQPPTQPPPQYGQYTQQPTQYGQ